MKQFKTLFIAVVLFFVATSSVSAQTNIAHINLQELLNVMPEWIAAQSELEKISQKYEEDYVLMNEVLHTNFERFQTEEASKTDEENERRVAEIESEQEDLQEYASMMQQTLEKKQTMLLTPIIEKVKTTISKVAKAQGFTNVLDSSPYYNVIMAEGKDLMLDVKRALGINE